MRMLTVEDTKLILLLPQVKYEIEWKGNVLYARKTKGAYKCLCGGELFPHHVASLHRAYKGWALDVAFKCRDCHLYVVHGIPCEKDERLRRFAGKFIINEDEEIRRRLEALGYW